MKMPSLPYDSIYKFSAVVGLIVGLLCTYIIYDSSYKLEKDLIVLVEEADYIKTRWHIDFQIKANDFITSGQSFMNNLRKDGQLKNSKSYVDSTLQSQKEKLHSVQSELDDIDKHARMWRQKQNIYMLNSKRFRYMLFAFLPVYCLCAYLCYKGFYNWYLLEKKTVNDKR